MTPEREAEIRLRNHTDRDQTPAPHPCAEQCPTTGAPAIIHSDGHCTECGKRWIPRPRAVNQLLRDESDLLAHVDTLTAERDAAIIEAADILEILGETAWGVKLPAIFVQSPRLGATEPEPLPTVIHPDSAKQLVEHVYRRLKDERPGWLKREREATRDAERRAMDAEKERDRLRRTLAVERGDASAAPEGWARLPDPNVIAWIHEGRGLVCRKTMVDIRTVRWVVDYGATRVTGTEADYALDSMDAALSAVPR